MVKYKEEREMSPNELKTFQSSDTKTLSTSQREGDAFSNNALRLNWAIFTDFKGMSHGYISEHNFENLPHNVM